MLNSLTFLRAPLKLLELLKRISKQNPPLGISLFLEGDFFIPTKNFDGTQALLNYGDKPMAKLILPEALRRFLEPPRDELQIPITHLNEFSTWLRDQCPKLYQVVFSSPSNSMPKMNGFLNLYVEDQSVTHRLSETLPLSESSALRLITSISGG